MNDIANAFNRVRYASDPNWEPRGHEPIGFDVTAGGDTLKAETPRRYVCDFLKENGREEEADSIQHYDGPVALDQGKLKPGRYDHQPVLDAMQPLEQHLDEWSMQGHAHPYIAINRGDHNEHLELGPVHGEYRTDHPLPADHAHIAHANGQFDSPDPEPYADVEHNLTHYDDLADHLADIIGDHAARQHRNNWGEHNGDEVMVNMDHSMNTDMTAFLGLLGHSYHSLQRLSYRDPLRELFPWASLGEGGVGDAEAAASTLSNLADDLEQPATEWEDGEHPYPGSDETRTEAAGLARSLVSGFEDLVKEPERIEKQNYDEFDELLKQFRQTRPVSPL